MKKWIVPCCGTLLLGGCFSPQNSSLKASSLTKEERVQKEEKNLELKNVKNIIINAEFTDILIEETPEENLSYIFIQELEPESNIDCFYKINVEQKEDTLSLSFINHSGYRCSVSRNYHLKIPKSFQGSLENNIEHSNSEISLSKVTSFLLNQKFAETQFKLLETPQVKIHSKDSNISFSSLQTKDLTITSTFSKINAEGNAENILISKSEHDTFKLPQMNSNKLIIQDSSFSHFNISGNIKELTYELEHGNIYLETQETEPYIKGDSKFSDIQITLPSSSHFKYRLLGDFSKLSTDFPVTVYHKNILEGEVGKETGFITLKAEHGSLRLKK